MQARLEDELNCINPGEKSLLSVVAPAATVNSFKVLGRADRTVYLDVECGGQPWVWKDVGALNHYEQQYQ